jgi:chitin disaccharide deacetylase
VKIIINADDLGYDAERDALAFSLMKEGKVTSATLMAIAPNFENAVEQARTFAGVSFGVHLTLTQFRLLSDNPIFRELGVTNSEGAVISDIRRAELRPMRAVQDAVFQECSLQIERVLDSGIRISHLDSHHHVHSSLWFVPVLRRLQMRFNIGRCRSAARTYLFANGPRRPHIRSNIMHFLLRFYCSVKTPDYFAGLDEGLRYLLGQSECDKDVVVELMCHPGNPRYEAETSLLKSDWIDAVKGKCKLINFTEI